MAARRPTRAGRSCSSSSKRGIVRKALRNDAELEQVHWSTNRHGDWSEMRIFAFDHRAQLEEMEGATPDRIGAFKQLCLEAALEGCRTAGPATVSCATAGWAPTRSARPRDEASGSAVRWNGRAPGRSRSSPR